MKLKIGTEKDGRLIRDVGVMIHLPVKSGFQDLTFWATDKCWVLNTHNKDAATSERVSIQVVRTLSKIQTSRVQILDC